MVYCWLFSRWGSIRFLLIVRYHCLGLLFFLKRRGLQDLLIDRRCAFIVPAHVGFNIEAALFGSVLRLADYVVDG